MKLDFLAIADIVIFFQGMLLALLFLTNRQGNRTANLLLGLFLFTQHFGLLHAFFLNSGLSAKFPYLLNVPSFFLHWVGPLLYLYTFSLLQPGFKIGKAHVIYFLPAIIETTGNLAILFLGARQIIQSIGMETFGNLIDGSTVIAVLYTSILLSKALWQVKAERVHRAGSGRNMMWLTVVLFYFTGRSLLVLAYIAGMSFGMDAILTTYWKDVLIFFTALDFSATLCLSFFSFRYMRDIHMQQKPASPQTNLRDSDFYFKRLTGLMTNERLYRRSDLKVSELAVALNINAKYVAQLVRQQTQLSISQYINTYRVEEIKTNMVERSHLLTLYAIAQEAGFNSKATFNRVFKEMTGMSPKEYKAHASVSTKEVSNSEIEA